MNLLVFLALLDPLGVTAAALTAFFVAAAVNYVLSVLLLFRRRAKWQSATELIVFLLVIGAVSLVDMYSTRLFVTMGMGAVLSKVIATAIGLFLNFAGRRFIVFPEKASEDWKPQGGPA